MDRLVVTLDKKYPNVDEIIGRWTADFLSDATVEKVTQRILVVESPRKDGHIASLKAQPEVQEVEEDTDAEVVDLDDESTAFVPTDPLYRKQWGLFSIGAGNAWRLGVTGRGQTIAIIDSGLDGTHPEFGGNGDQRINANLGPRTILAYYEPIMRRIRANHHPKIAPAYNFVDGNDNTFDFHRHGTSVASQAVAMGDSIGMVGVAPNARVAPYKVLKSDGRGSLSHVVEAMGKVLGTGIRVVNISLAFKYSSTALRVVIEEAIDAGILVLAASGNSNSEYRYYPAADDNVVAVGGTDKSRRIWTTSSIGSTWPCDIVAPAAAMPTAQKWRGRYTMHQGTSLASPHVAGVAALCLEIFPDMPVSVLKEVIFKSGGKNGSDPKWGHGEVNAFRAVKLAQEAKSIVKPEIDWEGYNELLSKLAMATTELKAWGERHSAGPK